MAKRTVTRLYEGWAPEAVAWDAVLRIFDSLWGPDARSLPAFPKIVGGVHASWTDIEGETIKADSLDELRDAYERRETAEITISGGVGNAPLCFFHYWPAARKAFVQVEAPARATAEELVDSVRTEFPLTQTRRPEWDSLSLTLAGIVYSVLLTITGVLIARMDGWLGPTVWAVAGVVLLILGLTFFKPKVIQFSERFLQPERRHH